MRLGGGAGQNTNLELLLDNYEELMVLIPTFVLTAAAKDAPESTPGDIFRPLFNSLTLSSGRRVASLLEKHGWSPGAPLREGGTAVERASAL